MIRIPPFLNLPQRGPPQQKGILSAVIRDRVVLPKDETLQSLMSFQTGGFIPPAKKQLK